MIFSDPASVLVTLRIIAGSVTMAFTGIAIMRLINQYRQRHFSQSIYSIILLSALFGDALLRTVALTIFPVTTTAITPASIFFLAGQWLIALGVMMFSLYLVGIVNGFWERPVQAE